MSFLINPYRFGSIALPGTPEVRFQIGDATTGSWADSSGNSKTATATGTPATGTEGGLDVINLLNADDEYYKTAATINCPTTSGTLVVVAKTGSNAQYNCLLSVRGAAGKVFAMNVSSGGTKLDCIFGGTFDFGTGVTWSSELALYAVTAITNSIKFYKIDSVGTTVTTDTRALSSIASETAAEFMIGNDIGFESTRGISAGIRHAEYHRNTILTQEQLETIYEIVVG